MSSVEGIIWQTKKGPLWSSFAALVLMTALSLYNSCTSSSNWKWLSSHDTTTVSFATADTLAYLHGQITAIQEQERFYNTVFHGCASVDTVARQQLQALSSKYAALLARIDNTPDDSLPQTSEDWSYSQWTIYPDPLWLERPKTVEDDPQ